jgi:hypothetical protein
MNRKEIIALLNSNRNLMIYTYENGKTVITDFSSGLDAEHYIKNISAVFNNGKRYAIDCLDIFLETDLKTKRPFTTLIKPRNRQAAMFCQKTIYGF